MQCRWHAIVHGRGTSAQCQGAIIFLSQSFIPNPALSRGGKDKGGCNADAPDEDQLLLLRFCLVSCTPLDPARLGIQRLGLGQKINQRNVCVIFAKFWPSFSMIILIIDLDPLLKTAYMSFQYNTQSDYGKYHSLNGYSMQQI